MRQIKVDIKSKKKRIHSFTRNKDINVTTRQNTSRLTRTKTLPKRLSHKSKKKKVSFGKFIPLLILIAIVGLGSFGYLRLQALNERKEIFDDEGEKVECTNILNPECWTDAFTPQLKQTDGFTNALIVGIDSRKEGERGASLMNTDTLIFASFNHETEETMLVSIPRDFYVDEYRTRINSVYAFTYKRNPDDPYLVLREMISKIVGKPVHYTSVVKLEGVVSAIDDIGGIEICPESYVRAKYPNDYPEPGEAGWLYYDFEEGCEIVDGERALVWARFRHVTRGDTSYASDFSRSRRQQEVIEGVKDTMLADEMSIQDRAETYFGLVETYKDTVSVDVGFEDILAGLAFLDSADRDPINVVLDPSFGGGNRLIYTPVNDGFYHIKAKDTSYLSIQAELDKIWEWSDFYRERPVIAVQNMSGEFLSSDDILKLIDESFVYDGGVYINKVNKTNLFTGIKVFDMSGGEVPRSLVLILEYLGIESIETFPPEEFGQSQTSRNEDILILLGPDVLPTVAPSTN